MNWITILFQSSLFYLFPFILGRALAKSFDWLEQTIKAVFFSKTVSDPYSQLSYKGQPPWRKPLVDKRDHHVFVVRRWLKVGNYLSLGIVSMFGLALFIRYVLVDGGGLSFERIWFPLIWGLLVIALAINLWRYPKNILDLLRYVTIPLLVVMSLTVFTVLIWFYRSPYPLNWDWYQHQTLARQIQQGEFSFFTSEMSDTFGFNSYPPAFHLVMATAQYPAQLTPDYLIIFWQSINVYHLILVGLASWGLGVAITRSQLVGLLSSIIGVLVFDSAISFTNLFLLPQTLSAVLFTLIFARLLMYIDANKTVPVWQSVSSVLVLAITHYIIGGLGLVIWLAFDIYSRLRVALPKLLSQVPVVPLIVLFAVFGVLASQAVDLEAFNRGEAGAYIFDAATKQGFLEHSYGYAFYVLFPVGVAYALLHRRQVMEISILITFGFLMILFSEFPYVLKFFTLARFWVNAFIAIGIWSLLAYIQWRWLRALVASGSAIAFGLILIVNLHYWKAGVLDGDHFVHLSQYDIEAAEFLQEWSQNKKVTLVSDPSTQFVLEGLSGVNTIEGAYLSLEPRIALYQALANQDASALVNYALQTPDRVFEEPQERLLVISGRSLVWAAAEEENSFSFNFNVWTPEKLSLDDRIFLKKLDKDARLSLIYESPYLGIFTVE